MTNLRLLLIVPVLVSACEKPPPVAKAARAVRVVSVVPRAVGQSTRYSGVLEARAQVDLAFRVAGRVASVGQASAVGTARRSLQEGDVVRAGDTLATLDLDDLRTQRSVAAAGVESMAAQVRTARTALEQSEREVKRARKLSAGGDLAQADLDRAEAAFSAASSSLASAEAQHQSRVDQLVLSQSTLTDATLRSPLDGVVARRAIDPGELVGPNVPIFSVVDVSALHMVFGAPDTRVNQVQLGQVVTVLVEALPGRRLSGTVTKVAPTADPALRTYAVELTVPGAADLRPGMTATALLDEQGRHEAPVLPLSAVVRRPDGPGYGVYAVRAGGTVELLPVEVEDLLENDVIIGSPLTPGTKVVVAGAQFLRAGEAVEVVP